MYFYSILYSFFFLSIVSEFGFKVEVGIPWTGMVYCCCLKTYQPHAHGHSGFDSSSTSSTSLIQLKDSWLHNSLTTLGLKLYIYEYSYWWSRSALWSNLLPHFSIQSRHFSSISVWSWFGAGLHESSVSDVNTVNKLNCFTPITFKIGRWRDMTVLSYLASYPSEC